MRVRARAHIEEIHQGKEAIIVTELPFAVKKGGDGGLITKIAELVHEKKIPEISDLRDESDRRGMRLVIELKRAVNPKVVLNKLYKHTPMQIDVRRQHGGAGRRRAAHALAASRCIHGLRRPPARGRRAPREVRAGPEGGARPRPRGPAHRARQPRRRHRAHPPVARPRGRARASLVDRFELSQIQAEAILDLRLSQLDRAGGDAIKQEHADVIERIRELRELLGDEANVLELIKEELPRSPSASATSAAREIAPSEDEIDIEDLIADQQMVITITKSGYIKSLPLATYRQQRRGGVGMTGMDMKDGDYIEHLFVCSTHDYLLFFTNRGKVYRSKVYELPEAARTAKGRALVNILPLREGERVQSVLSTRDFAESPYLVFATRKGTIKKTEFQAYNTPIKADGIIAIKIRDDDELVAVRRVDAGRRDHHGLARRAWPCASRRARRARWAATPAASGAWTSATTARSSPWTSPATTMDLLVVTETGYGKRTHDRPVPQDVARRQGRPDDQADRGQGRPGRRARRPPAPGARVHLPERDGPAHRRQRHLAAGPLGDRACGS